VSSGGRGDQISLKLKKILGLRDPDVVDKIRRFFPLFSGSYDWTSHKRVADIVT
jgi:hypothetical protein